MPRPSRLQAKVAVTEITGSESFVHLANRRQRWVMLAHGMHDFEPDRSSTVFIDTRHLMAFGTDGNGGRPAAAAA
jgi:glycerol transport system ATP-binding protein